MSHPDLCDKPCANTNNMMQRRTTKRNKTTTLVSTAPIRILLEVASDTLKHRYHPLNPLHSAHRAYHLAHLRIHWSAGVATRPPNAPRCDAMTHHAVAAPGGSPSWSRRPGPACTPRCTPAVGGPSVRWRRKYRRSAAPTYSPSVAGTVTVTSVERRDVRGGPTCWTQSSRRSAAAPVPCRPSRGRPCPLGSVSNRSAISGCGSLRAQVEQAEGTTV